MGEVRFSVRAVWGLAFLVALGCHSHSHVHDSTDGGSDAGPPDAGPPADAGVPDGGPVDAGPPDAGLPDAGWLGNWELFGPTLGHEAQVHPAMALDASGALIVAYVELVESPGVAATELHVVRWSGTAWEPLGGTVARSQTRFPYSAPLWVRLTTDGSGRPVLAFGDSGPGSSSGAFPVKTWVFDGVAWQPIPVPGQSALLGGFALGGDGDGGVQFALSTGQALEVWTLVDAGWTPTVPPLADDGGVSEPDLAVGPDGHPLVAFSEAPAPGSFGPLRVWRWDGGAWTDLAVPWPDAPGQIVHTPRVRARNDGGVVVAASAWLYDVLTKLQVGVGVPVLALAEGSWSVLEDDGAPGGFGLSEPIPGSPVDLQLAGDVAVVVSTADDGGVVLRAIPSAGGERVAPVLGGFGAGTLLLAPDGTPLVGAVMPRSNGPDAADAGQVQILHFTGSPSAASDLTDRASSLPRP